MSDLADDAAPPQEEEPKVSLTDRTVTYTFPVKVVVVGALTEDDYKVLEDKIWSDINDVLNR